MSCTLSSIFQSLGSANQVLKWGHNLGDDTVYICDICGGYRLSGTAEHLIKIGTISDININKIREIIRERRGYSNEFPTIT